VNNFRFSQSWSILTSIEQRIKAKIEEVGIPLKNWGIQINYGIKTGLNEAFIINGKKKDELFAADPRSAEIIRPILRGRDIKRYGYNFADLWLINTHNGNTDKGISRIDVSEFPAIKSHLDCYYEQLKERYDKGDSPYNLRSCAYMDDFYKQKIIYPDIMRMPRQVEALKEYPYFYYDEKNFFAEATNFIMTGQDIDLIYLFLASELGFFAFSKFYTGPQFDETGFRYKKAYLYQTYIPKPNSHNMFVLRDLMRALKVGSDTDNKINSVWYEIVGLNAEEIKYVSLYKERLLSGIIDESNFIIRKSVESVDQ